MRLNTQVRTLILFTTIAASVNTAQAITLTILAETDDIIGGKTINPVFSPISFNNNNVIAFKALTNTGSVGFFTPSEIIVDTDNPLHGRAISNLSNQISLNNNGLAAFRATLTAGGSVIATQNSILVEDGDMIDGNTLLAANNPVLSDTGTAVFGGNTGTLKVFTQNNLIAEPGNIIDTKTLSTVTIFPAISDSGNNIAFHATFPGGHGIFSPSNLLVENDAIISGKQLTNVISTSITVNDSGELAFMGLFNGGQGIFTQNRLVVAEGDVVDGETIAQVFSAQAINNNGQVTYLAEYNNGNSVGVFRDDQLLGGIDFGHDLGGGRTLTDIDRPTINDQGNLAFLGLLSDGNRAVILAVVPEPTSAALLTLTALPLLLRRRTRITFLPPAYDAVEARNEW